MGLLNRLAISGGSNQDYYTEQRNNIDEKKHSNFNDMMFDEVMKKIASLPEHKQQQAMRDLGLI